MFPVKSQRILTVNISILSIYTNPVTTTGVATWQRTTSSGTQPQLRGPTGTFTTLSMLAHRQPVVLHDPCSIQQQVLHCRSHSMCTIHTPLATCTHCQLVRTSSHKRRAAARGLCMFRRAQPSVQCRNAKNKLCTAQQIGTG